jgi:hypothetical protein
MCTDEGSPDFASSRKRALSLRSLSTSAGGLVRFEQGSNAPAILDAHEELIDMLRIHGLDIACRKKCGNMTACPPISAGRFASLLHKKTKECDAKLGAYPSEKACQVRCWGRVAGRVATLGGRKAATTNSLRSPTVVVESGTPATPTSTAMSTSLDFSPLRLALKMPAPAKNEAIRALHVGAIPPCRTR